MQNCPDIKIVNSFWSWSKKCLEEPKISLCPQMLKLTKFRYGAARAAEKITQQCVAGLYLTTDTYQIWPHSICDHQMTRIFSYKQYLEPTYFVSWPKKSCCKETTRVSIHQELPCKPCLVHPACRTQEVFVYNVRT